MIHCIFKSDYENPTLIAVVEGPDLDIEKLFDDWVEKKIGKRPSDRPYTEAKQKAVGDWVKAYKELNYEEFVNSLGMKIIEYKESEL